ncbi:MAG TPA: PIN domain nuclease [Sphingomonas sp.]|jgi:hypothetical protein|uniref:type II toxin-antitoxin system VapC family toxin n=1 Tax=Sphingomonas sp. TaxID=28214 RepID=UPI002ED7D77F
MILIDTSVWIDLFADRATPQVLRLLGFINEKQALAIGDLVLTEVLQGARDDAHARRLLDRLRTYEPITIVNGKVAIAAAGHYRALRGRGLTVRTTIDTLIATRCILDGIPLLYSDRDFDPFVAHLGLRSALDLDPGVN